MTERAAILFRDMDPQMMQLWQEVIRQSSDFANAIIDQNGEVYKVKRRLRKLEAKINRMLAMQAVIMADIKAGGELLCPMSAQPPQ